MAWHPPTREEQAAQRRQAIIVVGRLATYRIVLEAVRCGLEEATSPTTPRHRRIELIDDVHGMVNDALAESDAATDASWVHRFTRGAAAVDPEARAASLVKAREALATGRAQRRRSTSYSNDPVH